MLSLLKKRVVLVIGFCIICHVNTQVAPKASIEILKPKGLRVSIPHSPTTTLFAFHGNVNRQIQSDDIGSISGEVLSPTNGRWVFEDHNLELKKGDVINYYVFIYIDKAGYLVDNLKYTVEGNNDETTTEDNKTKDCSPSVTTVRGSTSKICPGDVIFEDDFTVFNRQFWQIEQKIPFDNSEYPFVSYQRLTIDSPTVKVENGHLEIWPQLQQTVPGFTNESIISGTLDLRDGCTDVVQSCYISANGANILPPVVSGRITSKAFAFKYGKVQVRARLPQGDWLYPEILLEPFLHKYGMSNFASGIIKIAAARGNDELFLDGRKYDNGNLYGGPIISFECHDVFLISGKVPPYWGTEFHTYELRWEPDKLVFLVNDIEWGRVQPGYMGLREKIYRLHCRDAPRNLWSFGEKMAPFDEFFHLTLGVAAGGVLDFPDHTLTTKNHSKPWINSSSKAKLNFWLDQDHWFATWKHNSPLRVDWIKVTAL